MTTHTRDPFFATYVDQIADSIRWPDPSFTVTPWDAVIGVLAALYDAFSAPDRATLHFALEGIAF
jgi:hypothetical protein